jgi:hypothetical protein
MILFLLFLVLLELAVIILFGKMIAAMDKEIQMLQEMFDSATMPPDQFEKKW